MGAVMVYSSTYALAISQGLNGEFFLKRHLVAIACGISAFVIIQFLKYSLVKRMVPLVTVLGGLSLLLVLHPNLGIEHGGFRRWFQIGPFSVQPTEFCRFILLAFFAYFLERKDSSKEASIRGYLILVLVWLAASFLILLEPNYGLFAEMGIFFLILLYATDIPRLPLACVAAIYLCAVVVFMFTSEYRIARLVAFLEPYQHYQTSGYQVIQSLVSFSNGGLLGVGIGAGIQKLFYLPEPYTDYIFAVIGEELGFFGVVTVATTYLILLFICLRISERAPDIFGAVFCLGAGVLLTLSAFLNMCVCLKLLPPTGMVLPFVSYGGSSMVASFAALAVVYRVGRECNQS
jgi:cell division protein FtsW